MIVFRTVLCAVAVSLAGCFSLHAQAPQPQAGTDAYSAVDPMVGTGAEGHTYPGATVPFGMVQLSPDTQIRPVKQSYKWAAGYRYSDTTILGFSHTHFSGAGHSDLGDVLVQPVSGDVHLDPGDIDKPGSGYRSRFSHASETAKPGYYAVTLDDDNVRAELTATTRVGVHRYTFPAGKPAHLLVDLRSSIYNYPGKVLWSRLRVRQDGSGNVTVTGMRQTRGWAPGRQLYFAMRFSAPVAGTHLYNREDQPVLYAGFKTPGDGPENKQAIEGRGLVGVFDFGTSARSTLFAQLGPNKQQVDFLTQPLSLVVKVAISPVSEENAIANMDGEVPAFDFDGVRAAAVQQWTTALGIMKLEADNTTRKNLYTALYHSLLAPTVSMDSNGEYRGPDNQVHRAPAGKAGFTFVSSLSLWDTYRAEQPLMTLIEPPQKTADLVRSMLASQQQSPFGILPVWQFQGIETWCMIGYHSIPILADAVMKGLDKPTATSAGFDANAALDAMVASADYAPYGHLGEYMKLGYVPVSDGAHDEAVSQTVEYAFDDWCIGQVARKLGRANIAARFDKRAGNWKNVFDTKVGFVRPKTADGAWREPFDPAAAGSGSGFTEGNAWQYSWYEPQDEAGLIAALGGPQALVKKLDEMFDQKVDMARYADVEDISGMIGQYIHGNEPSHHLAYLYSYAGQPWRTQERLKQIVESQYKPTPDGLVGNDDLGQMSAWLLFTSLGFYPVAPGANQYVLGRPFVHSAVLTLGNGKILKISAKNLSDANDYVQSVSLNGKSINRTYLTQEEVIDGGDLKFVMGPHPDRAWATGGNAVPYSMTDRTNP